MSSCFASDNQREASYADALQHVTLGKATWLDAAGQKFLGLYAEAGQADKKAGVIILHDKYGSPDQQPLISQLRAEFFKHQLATLSLQMPLSEPDASVEDDATLITEALPRITAGIEFLTKQNFKSIILVGYGLGGVMALSAQAEKELAIKALVLISLPGQAAEQKNLQTLTMLKNVKLPLLDIYAERDLAEVKGFAGEKRLTAKENSGYRQVRIDNEEHLFRHQSELVAKRIYSWLSREGLTTE